MTFLFNYIFSLSQYKYIADLAYMFSYPLAYLAVFIIFFWAIFISKKKMMNFSLFFLTGISTWFVVRTLKMIFEVPRPFLEMNIVPMFYEKGFSFPSEHTALFFSFAVCMFFINKKLGLAFSVFALLVGLSRVVLGVHYPIDIIGGALIGLFIGFLYYKLFKKI